MSFNKEQKKERSQQGFTLIELAIVLIIIGLIIGAVLKGQDLIQNARIKSFVNYVRGAEISEWSYYDRNGEFALSVAAVGTNATTLQTLDDFSESKTIGSATFFIRLLEYTDTNARVYNALLLGHDTNVATALDVANDDQEAKILEYYKALDTAIDGSADGTAGSVRAITALGGTLDATNGAVVSTTEPTYAATGWGDQTNIIGAVYYYDQTP